MRNQGDATAECRQRQVREGNPLPLLDLAGPDLSSTDSLRPTSAVGHRTTIRSWTLDRPRRTLPPILWPALRGSADLRRPTNSRPLAFRGRDLPGISATERSS